MRKQKETWLDKNSLLLEKLIITFKQHKHLCTFEFKLIISLLPVYAMCQATGYKHTSNKELPAPNIPWLRRYFPATVKVVDQTNITATVNAGQRYPFYII